MRSILLLSSILFSITAVAVTTDISGNLEGQWRHAKNNDEAQEDLMQNWDESDFFLAYGNLSGKVESGSSRVEANWFGRYTKSELYEPEPNEFGVKVPNLATEIFTFPQKLVARDVFQMQSKDQSGDHQTESVLNKFYYEYTFDQNRFMFGRMYVNYGLGEIFNPINPFNQPTALTSIANVAQGNDGMSFTFFVTEYHNMQILLLGDKAIEGYDGSINTTFWVHGEIFASDKLQLDYVIGSDQNRDKIGGQASYQFEDAMIFTQAFYQSRDEKSDASNTLFDALVGADSQLTSKWHLRLETGYQKENRYLDPERLDRFLPSEYFVALANVYEAHPLLKLNGTVINDIKSGFTYLILKATYSLGNNAEIEAFGFSPVSQGDDTDLIVQKLVTTDFGLSLRAFF